MWGLNDKDQLGGQKGSKIKLPVFSDTLSNLKPIHIAGGSKSLFIVTQEGKVFACGEGEIFPLDLLFSCLDYTFPVHLFYQLYMQETSNLNITGLVQ